MAALLGTAAVRVPQELASPAPAQAPRAYEAVRASAPVVVDGVLDDSAWDAASWTHDFVDIRGEWEEPALRTRAKILWDSRFLYVAAEVEEPHLWGTLTERDAIVYRDDDFEVFLDPDGNGLDYFELEINPLGTVLDLFLARPYRSGGTADLTWDMPGLVTGVGLQGTPNDPSDVDRGWTVELAIAWADLVPPAIRQESGSAAPSKSVGVSPAPGDIWRMNFSRVDWPLTTEDGGYRKTALPSQENPHPESNWVWSPQGVIDMHIPALWGFVHFVD